jgi:AraC family transcriptional activator of pobA
VQRLRTLVEAQFRHQPTLAALADQLAITPTQLNRICHQVLGHSASRVLHQRLALEAQRDLAYTSMSVKQIALALGFSDAAYFTRFFRRCTGKTPTDWRAASAGYARDRTSQETPR